MQPSNSLIVNGAKVSLPQAVLDLGVRGTNYIDDGEPCLRNKPRTATVAHLVLHETGI